MGTGQPLTNDEFEEWFPHAYQVCRRVLSDVEDAKDAAMDTLMKAHKKRISVRDHPNPVAWIKVVSALKQLPRGQRDAVLLRYFADLTSEDAAQVLDCSPGTIRSAASAGLARLRGLLPEVEFDE
jgi:DNA-directed RNA polymerase specialized sigma24 family protein